MHSLYFVYSKNRLSGTLEPYESHVAIGAFIGNLVHLLLLLLLMLLKLLLLLLLLLLRRLLLPHVEQC